jgi:hypothetical protein
MEEINADLEPIPLERDLERQEALTDVASMYLAGLYPVEEVIIDAKRLLDTVEEYTKFLSWLGIEA